MYYYIILCSGSRTSGMATDRLKLESHSRSVRPRPPACRECLATRDMVSILAISSVRERAKRAEPLLSLHSLRTINPPTSRMSRKSCFARSINAGAPSLERDPPMGVRPFRVVYMYHFRHFCQKSTTSVHYRA